ncbi:MAG: Acetyl-coenzyme A synthetase [Turneriella sp.]|nr:Acetyl-coenzyme A synthetase [Turneriella sp.]
MVDVLWQPPEDNAMARFRAFVGKRIGRKLHSYSELYDYSIKHNGEFWLLFIEYAQIPFLKPPAVAMEIRSPWRKSQWFPGSYANWAQMALQNRRNDTKLAVESFDEKGARVKWSFADLYRRVAAFQQLVQSEGLSKGGKLAAFMPNTEETLLTLLASVSCGATFSSTSPDFGVGAAADRLTQFNPQILVASAYYFFKGKKISVLEKIIEISKKVEALKTLFIFRAEKPDVDFLQQTLPQVKIVVVTVEEESAEEIRFAPYAFEDPLYVMYSSGTTGLPKGIIQGHGVIINHVKEHTLHCGSSSADKIFYYTTCGWMMYNWLVSALCFGASLVLFDGNPFHHGSELLFKLARETGLTVFGTSAKYLTTLMQHKFEGKEILQKSKVRLILSTGSVLPPEGFRYVYEHLHPSIHLASISGGTDLNGCWALGNPDEPVVSGELQSRGLGMAVEIFNDEAKPVVDEMGELVCTKPFPSMPLGFLGDTDGARYKSSYFDRFPQLDVWAHGDFACLTKRGSIVLGGRSDATLNPGGVRIGTAEIYRVLEQIGFIEDSLIIGRPMKEAKDDEEIVLFVKLQGENLTDEQISVIKNTIREKVSPRHVPQKIFQVKDIPYTINGKKVELAVKYIALGRAITNRETIANKDSLLEYEKLLKA